MATLFEWVKMYELCISYFWMGCGQQARQLIHKQDEVESGGLLFFLVTWKLQVLMHIQECEGSFVGLGLWL